MKRLANGQCAFGRFLGLLGRKVFSKSILATFEVATNHGIIIVSFIYVEDMPSLHIRPFQIRVLASLVDKISSIIPSDLKSNPTHIQDGRNSGRGRVILHGAAQGPIGSTMNHSKNLYLSRTIQIREKKEGRKALFNYLILSIKIAISNTSNGRKTIFKFTTAIHSTT